MPSSFRRLQEKPVLGQRLATSDIIRSRLSIDHMNTRIFSASVIGVMLALSFGIASADTALSVTCVGTSASSSIMWTATPVGGIAPYALLWGNGATSSSQTLSYAPGTYTMSIQATDASSTVATSTCSSTVAIAAPTISSFTANPAAITIGQSSLLSWTVGNASSTSVSGVGVVAGTSVTVSPTTTSTYTLSAVNPSGTTTATATITVSATTGGGTGIAQQIQALLQQIRALQLQIAQLIASQFHPGTGTTTPPVIPPGQFGKAICIKVYRDLTLGDRGDDVKSIQQLLNEDPSLGFNLSPTGFFGPVTAKALIRFQIKNGIASSSDGRVGPLTRGFFERRCGKGLENGAGPQSTTTSKWLEDRKHERGERPERDD